MCFTQTRSVHTHLKFLRVEEQKMQLVHLLNEESVWPGQLLEEECSVSFLKPSAPETELSMDALDVPGGTLQQCAGAYSLNGVLEEGVDARYIFRGESASDPLSTNASRYWAVILVDFDTLEDLQQACFPLKLRHGMGLRVWPLIDEESWRWTGVFVFGNLSDVDVRQLPVPATGRDVFSLCVDRESILPGTPRCVYMMPWFEYGKWYARSRVLLDSSYWQYSVGEDINALEESWYLELEGFVKLIAGEWTVNQLVAC